MLFFSCTVKKNSNKMEQKYKIESFYLFYFYSFSKVNKHTSQSFHSCLKTKYFFFTSEKQHIMEYVRKFRDNLKCVFFTKKLFFIKCYLSYQFSVFDPKKQNDKVGVL